MKTFKEFLNEESINEWRDVPIESFERYHSIKTKNIDDITLEDIKFVLNYLADEEGLIMGEFVGGVYTKSDILKHLLSHFKNIQNEPNPITLFRILNVSSKNDINLKRLGKHYQLSDMNLGNLDLGFSNGWVVKIETDKSNINVDFMFKTNIGYPNEFEVTLKDYSDYKILDIYEK